MADLTTIQTRIDQIDTLLAGGVESVGTDGDLIKYDLDALKSERDRLTRIVASSTASQFRRVVFRTG